MMEAFTSGSKYLYYSQVCISITDVVLQLMQNDIFFCHRYLTFYVNKIRKFQFLQSKEQILKVHFNAYF